MSASTRREFLTSVPAIAGAMAIEPLATPPTPATEPKPRRVNHPAFVRLELATIGLQEAILDFLAVEAELDEDVAALGWDADHLLFDLDRLDGYLGQYHLGFESNDPVRQRRLAFLAKLVRRQEQVGEERERYQNEALHYDAAQDEVAHTKTLLAFARTK